MKLRQSESQLALWAAQIAETIVIRDADGDYRRDATADESAVLYNIAYGALLALNCCCTSMEAPDKMARAIINGAEFTICNFINDCIGYMTMFAPLNYIWVNEWARKED